MVAERSFPKAARAFPNAFLDRAPRIAKALMLHWSCRQVGTPTNQTAACVSLPCLTNACLTGHKPAHVMLLTHLPRQLTMNKWTVVGPAPMVVMQSSTCSLSTCVVRHCDC